VSVDGTGAHANNDTSLTCGAQTTGIGVAKIRFIPKLHHFTDAARSDSSSHEGKIMIRQFMLVGALVAAIPQASFAKDEENTLTHGMVQMNLKVGTTTQGQIIEAFGGPNITTIDGGGQEMWVYDRHATVSYDKTSGFSIGLLGGGGGGGAAGLGGLGFGNRKSKSTQSSRSMTLIIKFDANKVVSDFQSRSSSF
jgi:hypothetical protein